MQPIDFSAPDSLNHLINETKTHYRTTDKQSRSFGDVAYRRSYRAAKLGVVCPEMLLASKLSPFAPKFPKVLLPFRDLSKYKFRNIKFHESTF